MSQLTLGKVKTFVFRLQEVGFRPQDFLGMPVTEFSRWEDRGVSDRENDQPSQPSNRFPDLAELPPEIGL